MAIKNILFDFDGVILDSMAVRDKGFYKILETYPLPKVEQLLTYHRQNGGLSRYNKLRHFFNNILGTPANENEVQALSAQFSTIMKAELTNKEYLIHDALDFIKQVHKHINLHIVSGSDGVELNYLCKELDIAHYFLSIQGSPTPKTELVHNLLSQYGYAINQTILIGDSLNDYDAARANGIGFAGYNNPQLIEKGNYIASLCNFNPNGANTNK